MERVGLCFVGGDFPFPGGFCFAPVCVAVAGVAGLKFLYRIKLIMKMLDCSQVTQLTISSQSIHVTKQSCVSLKPWKPYK